MEPVKAPIVCLGLFSALAVAAVLCSIKNYKMAPMALSLTIFLPQFVVATPTQAYDLLGHGFCLDSQHEYFEQWYVAGWDVPSLIYKHDLSECSCPECEELCNQNERCMGYDFFCCPENERCTGGASVLFSLGTRPSNDPPAPFSRLGPFGSDTIGEHFKGKGDIVNFSNETSASCYRKPTAPEPPTPAPASGSCCWGSSSCDSASNCHADAFCGASEEQCGACAGVWCPHSAAVV